MAWAGGEVSVLALPFAAADSAMSLSGWRHAPLAFWKQSTDYRFERDDGVAVVRAQARAAASALIHDVDVDPARLSTVRWRWKIVTAVEAADNRVKRREDASARLMLEFDEPGAPLRTDGGDLASAFATRNPLHAVLMYITSDVIAVGSIVVHPRTDHVRMYVVANARSAAGRWEAFARNYRADFIRAFGRPPGRLNRVGVMTDSDNTQGDAEALYADLVFTDGSAQ